MDKPEGIITEGYSVRIKKWCEEGVSLDDLKKKISYAQTLDELREILRNYPEYKDQLEPLAIARKDELTVKNIKINKISGNGIDQGK